MDKLLAKNGILKISISITAKKQENMGSYLVSPI